MSSDSKDEPKEALKLLTKEQKVELLRMFNRCISHFSLMIFSSKIHLYILDRELVAQKIVSNNQRMDPNGDGYVDLREFRTYLMEKRIIFLSSRTVENQFNAIR